MEVESKKISGNSTHNLFNKYNTKFLYFLKNTKNFLLTIHKILNNKTSRVILIENYIIKM
jgi:hypothetical protein